MIQNKYMVLRLFMWIVYLGIANLLIFKLTAVPFLVLVIMIMVNLIAIEVFAQFKFYIWSDNFNEGLKLLTKYFDTHAAMAQKADEVVSKIKIFMKDYPQVKQ